MGVVSQEVKSLKQEYKCDCCGQGMLAFTGYTQTSYPPSYQHCCNQCGEHVYLKEVYPRVAYSPLNVVPLNEDDGEIEGYVGR